MRLASDGLPSLSSNSFARTVCEHSLQVSVTPLLVALLIVYMTPSISAAFSARCDRHHVPVTFVREGCLPNGFGSLTSSRRLIETCVMSLSPFVRSRRRGCGDVGNVELFAFSTSTSLIRGDNRTAPRQCCSTSANSKQHGDVLPHFREQRCLGFGMKLRVAARPVQASEPVD